MTFVLPILGSIFGLDNFVAISSGIYGNAAKGYCECEGHLAILDTAEKQTDLLSQV